MLSEGPFYALDQDKVERVARKSVSSIKHLTYLDLPSLKHIDVFMAVYSIFHSIHGLQTIVNFFYFTNLHQH